MNLVLNYFRLMLGLFASHCQQSFASIQERMIGPKGFLHFGWVVLGATFYLNLVIDGYCFIFGFLKLEIEEDYPEYTPWAIASIVGVVRTIYLGFAPICIAVTEYFGPAPVIAFASTISAVAFLLTWINSFLRLGFYFDMLTLGVLQGISSALLYGPSIAVIPKYFPHHQRSLASGITTCGSPVGAIVYSLIVPSLFSNYGWRGAMTVFSGLSLNGLVCAAIFLDGFKSKIIHHHHHHHNHKKESHHDVFHRFFNVKLLCTPSFVSLLTAGALSMIGYYVPMLLVPKQGKHGNFGVDLHVQQNLVLIFGIFNAIGRIVTGRLADYGKYYKIFTSYWIFIIGLSVSAASLLAFTPVMFLGNVSFIAFVVIYGFFIAPIVSMRSIIVCDLYGVQNASATFGWFLSIQGIVQLIGFVLPTWLDTISPLYAYLFGASCFLLSALFVGFTYKPFFEARRTTKQSAHPKIDIVEVEKNSEHGSL